MVDYTSSLYLGLKHSKNELKDWRQLTSGKPAVLHESKGIKLISCQLAKLQGLESAVLGVSTLHLFWDFFSVLPINEYIIYMDAGCYPVVKWGVKQGTLRGITTKFFEHKSPNSLLKLLIKDKYKSYKPIIVSDSWCTSCGKPFPVREYWVLANRFNGKLLIDDTQTLGILGKQANKRNPYGLGGGGILQWAGIQKRNVITISSLAKGFGAPIACLAGDKTMVDWFKNHSKTRVFTSPPSFANINALQNALKMNVIYGDKLRKELFENVRYFKRKFANCGLSLKGGIFPFQKLIRINDNNPANKYSILKKSGIITVPVKIDNGFQIGFLIRADISKSDIYKTAKSVSTLFKKNKI